MYQPRHLSTSAPRRGVILLVVLAMLALFAVVGVSFVLLSDVETQSSIAWRDAVKQDQSSPGIVLDAQLDLTNSTDVQPLFAWWLNQFIYDVKDNDPIGVQTALRGHSLARLVYGYNYNPLTPNDLRVINPLNPADVRTINQTPWNGSGRLHTQTGTYMNPFYLSTGALDDYFLINYTYFNSDGFLRDPERLNPNPPTPTSNGWRTDLSQTVGAYTGGANVSYTYPDLNNLFLGAMKADGTIIMPSFHRPWLFGSLDSSNPNWTNSWGKYLLLRPRPIDMGPGFPYPEDLGGDVKNVTFARFASVDPLTGKTTYYNNDSVWVDLGYPVVTLPNGKKVKPLFAMFIMDLDNRLNVNVHGNIRGIVQPQQPAPTPPTFFHASHDGWGPTEVNLGKVLTQGNAALSTGSQEWTQLFTGNLTQAGRYGGPWNDPKTAVPVPRSLYASNQANGSGNPKFYAMADVDAVQEPTYGPSTRYGLPGDTLLPNKYPTSGSFTAFPYFSFPSTWSLLPAQAQFAATPATYGNGGNSGDNLFELTNHPLLYSYFQPVPPNGQFSVNAMNSLLRFGCQGVGSDPLLQLAPANLADGSDPVGQARRRRLLTTHSFDISQPAVTPWLHDTTLYPYGAKAPVQPSLPGQPPRGGGVPALSLVTRNYGVNNAEFGGADWRAIEAVLGKVDLNRPLPDYPATLVTSGVDTGHFDLTDATTLAAFNAAQSARQGMAQDIFTRLLWVVMGQGTLPPATITVAGVAVPNPDYQAARWLAQLSVNIVDYIDTDDYITPFKWDLNAPGGTLDGYVYGTELPRVLLNEVYGEYARNELLWRVRIWTELHNPLMADTNLRDSGNARLQVIDGATNYSVYEIQITQPNVGLRSPDNVDGHADARPASPSNTNQQTYSRVGGSAAAPQFLPTGISPPYPVAITSVLLAANGAYQGTKGNDGFYLIGPPVALPSTGPTPPVPVPTLQTSAFQYLHARDVLAGQTTPPNPTIILRRLACPSLPPNPAEGGIIDLTKPYNPYVTVDYMENVPLNDGGTFTIATPPAGHYSFGRTQPYAGNTQPYTATTSPAAAAAFAAQSQLKPQAPAVQLTPTTTGPYPNQPQHTFFRHNAVEATATPTPPSATTAGQTLKIPFDWLVHLDRTLISPMELLHVSAYKPHELTQQFVMPPVNSLAPSVNTIPQSFQHVAPWFDPTTRLYRVFEMLETHTRAAGVARGGRIPGTINLNTIWDVDTFRAICDSQVANGFSDAQVIAIFNQMVAQRTTGLGGFPGQLDRPFQGQAAGLTAVTTTTAAITPTLPPPALPSPVPVTAMSGTIGGNLPWAIQVGSELVVDSGANAETVIVTAVDTTNKTFTATFILPHVAGALITPLVNNGLENTLLRSLTGGINAVTTLTAPITVALPPAVPTVQTATPAAMSGAAVSPPWSIQVGSQLVIDSGNNAELVTVTAVTPTTFSAVFTLSHAAGAYIAPPTSVYTSFAGGPQRLLEVPGATHPYQKAELLTKIYNQVTTRSNVFAVWTTVGYFEVTDGLPTVTSLATPITINPPSVPAGSSQAATPVLMSGTAGLTPWKIQAGSVLMIDTGANAETVQVASATATTFTANFQLPHAANAPIAVYTMLPVKLGAEVGKAENKNIRHRMFAIVDRSALTYDATTQTATATLPGVRPVLLSTRNAVVLNPVPVPAPVPPPPTPATLNIDSLTGTYEGTAWAIKVGTVLLADPGPNQELITVTAVTAPVYTGTSSPGTFTASFTKAHNDGMTVTFPQGVPGNPGPQPLNYDPRGTPVVPLATVID